MSLIEEALRRIKDPLLPGQGTPSKRQGAREETPPAHPWSANPPPSSSAATSAPHTTPALVGVTVVVVALTAALIIGGTLWMRQVLRERAPGLAEGTQALSVTNATDQDPSADNPKRDVLKPANTPNDLVLSGVVEGSGEPYAVINGKVIGVGETIGGTTLLAIGNGAVTLRRADGSEIVLRVPH